MILKMHFQMIQFHVGCNNYCYKIIIFNFPLVAVKRKYELQRRQWKEDQDGDEIRSKRIKKAKYDQRKVRVSC